MHKYTQTEAIISPVANSDAMKKHLELIAKATPVGMYSVVNIDRASWHQAQLVETFLIPVIPLDF